MSIFGDYKAYKRYEPTYPSWKNNRNLIDAKRQKYIKENPKKINTEDMQRGKVLLRAIDVMDEYSQKRAEDMEVATGTAVGYGLDLALFGGGFLGLAIGKLKPVKNLIAKTFKENKSKKVATKFLPMGVGAFAGMLSAFPLFAWAAKAEVGASRRGRFEAMRKDLNNPNVFAVLTPEQLKEAKQKANTIVLPKDKKTQSLNNGLKNLKEMAIDSPKYKQQKKLFEIELQENEKHLNDAMNPKEIENAKKDQQLLTKLVEKIDIASQDYAENAELATSALITGAMGFGALFSLLVESVLRKCKVKSATKIAATIQALSILAPIALSIMAAQIQKEASRVGRFKIKQDLMAHPEKLAYVKDEDIKNIKNISVAPDEKTGMFKFLKNAWKNQKEYNNYKKTTAKEEEKFFKALEKMELSEEQIKDAKRLQRNTFKTFNKVDEKSQKYSESIEALGQAISYPVSLLFTGLGMFFGLKHLDKAMKLGRKDKSLVVKAFTTYIGVVLLSMLPSIGINAYVTKQQKKASRIADMLAINEMSDYRHFK